ncbi:nitroreductase [Lucifera butyrica]|uniref:Nitroreductase n=1 Tax=Lucifera butyrica TaxID=1351585 RepID=A0A498RDH3_9FIRM|nr:nitroreductase family protein [Lucifera butyrica]VBB09369.1 nitroreductase [Lucifera butyrica]
MNLIEVNSSQCVRCGICAEVCPVGILAMGEDGIKAINPEACIACGHCVAVCPQAAIDNKKTPLAEQKEIESFPVFDAETAQLFLRARRSIRSYKKMTVPREKLLQLIEIARFAPTASNKQGVSFTIVEDKNILQKATERIIEWMEGQEQSGSHWSFVHHIRAYREFGRDPILRDAPHLIIATAPPTLARGRENTVFSLAYLELYAPALGLGSCWAGLLEMCAFAGYGPLLDLFKIPEGKVITGAVMAGYPKYSYKRLVNRNPLDITWL